jgi:4-hydroxybenzoate polyprenyltransferase
MRTALPWLRLVRAGTLFSPGADVVAGLCIAGMPWSAGAVRTVLASIAVYAAGMILNDHADRARDARVRPERPLPSGAIAPRAALVAGLALLAVGVALSASPAWHALLAALVLLYDYVVKARALAGALLMGALRALNLLAGGVALTGAFPPRPLLIAAGAYGLYIVAVTVLGILEDDERVKPRTVESIQLVPPVCAALAFLAMPQPWPAAAFAFGLAAVFLARVRRVREWTQVAMRASMTWLLLGTMLYTGLLCLASGRPWESLAVLAAVPLARAIARRIALT